MSGTVRAKFYCWQKILDNGGTTVVLSPTTGDNSEEDKLFWAATPSGKLEMRLNNQAAAQRFEIGKYYYLDFTPAE